MGKSNSLDFKYLNFHFTEGIMENMKNSYIFSNLFVVEYEVVTFALTLLFQADKIERVRNEVVRFLKLVTVGVLGSTTKGNNTERYWK